MVIRKWVLEQILFVLVSEERSVSGEDRVGNLLDRGPGDVLMGQGRLSVPKEA